MNKLVMILLVVVMSVAAQAAPTLFTFNSLGLLAGEGAISQYMTNLYGSKVVVDDAIVWQGDGFGTTKYITTLSLSCDALWDGNFDIKFKEEGVKCVCFDWFVFDDTSGADFTFKAYDASGVKIWEWNAELAGQSCRNQTGGGTYCTDFGGLTATRLFFSNAGIHDVGIDNLKVNWCVIPAPGAVLLGSLGIGMVGWLRRRASL